MPQSKKIAYHANTPSCSVTHTGDAQTKNVLKEKEEEEEEKKKKKKKKKKEKRTGPFCRDCAALAGRSLKRRPSCGSK